MKKLLIPLLLSLSGCSIIQQGPPEDLYMMNKKVSHNFLYVSDEVKWGKTDHWETNVTGDHRFSGDCEEYAFAVAHQLARRGISSTSWVVTKPEWGTTGQAHAITCSDTGWCFDYGQQPFRKEHSDYIWVMTVSELAALKLSGK